MSLFGFYKLIADGEASGHCHFGSLQIGAGIHIGTRASLTQFWTSTS